MPAGKHDRTVCELSVLAALVSLTCVVVALAQPWNSSAGSPIRFETNWFWFAGWVLLQAATIAFAVPAVATLAARIAPEATLRVGRILLLSLPVVLAFDAVVFRWAGERFLSRATWRIISEHSWTLAPYLSLSSWLLLIAGIAGLILLLSGVRVASSRASSRWLGAARHRMPYHAPAAMFVALCIATIAIHFSPRGRERLLVAMATDSSRHPLCIFRIVPYRGVGPAREVQAAEPRGPEAIDVVVRRGNQQRLVHVASQDGERRSRDVLIVVVESLRSELLDPDVMPNLWSLSQRGITCKTHFSGGNSTNLGMFSLFNGLDAIWFGQPVTYSPLLNRLFRSAGYEVGFFGGRDDWRTFRMDGFIDSQHYDVFETLPYAGLLSDRRATELAIRFLSPDGGMKPSSEPDRKPRLAILYLYGTHAIYHSYVEDRVFAPAADERLPYPYSDSMRDQVWNRYKNAARTVDRFIGSVMREDLAMLVVGDHGEAFLEDGTIGHGIRISRQQNMTPAVLATPDTLKRAIHAPTGHIDLLPTLLESERIRISDPSVFDGKSLLRASDAELQSRVIATCNFLDSSVALIGTWTVTPSFPFAFRAVVSKDLRSHELLNAIDGQGYQLQGEWRDMATEALEQWIASWTPQPSLTSEVVQADARTSAEHQAR